MRDGVWSEGGGEVELEDGGHPDKDLIGDALALDITRHGLRLHVHGLGQ